jgi:hypothetical protein
LVAVVCVALALFAPSQRRAGAASKLNFDMYTPRVPEVNVNLSTAGVRLPTAVQQDALSRFKSEAGSRVNVRWNAFAGSPEIITGFHTAPSTDTPENTARAFVSKNAALFGVSPEALVLVDRKDALGGHLLRFQQRAAGVDVATGGLGLLMNANNQIRMVMGSTFRDAGVSAATPSLDAASAAARAQTELARYAALNSNASSAAFDELQKQVAQALRAPRLNVFPTADGYRLAWNVQTFSRNPFGMFVTQVDANTGEVLARENLVKYQSAELPNEADIFPNHPVLKNPDTGELLKDAGGVPVGLQRVKLRNLDPGANATGTQGMIVGTHAFIKNVLATQQPFAAAALGTWYFEHDNAPLEAQPNESDDFAEPAEHFDESNIYFFINYLLEYVDDLHRRDDLVHNRIGTGDFPDTYPNYDRPLVGLPHFPNDCGQAGLGSPCDTSSPDAIQHTLLGLDNAFSLPVVETVDTPAGPQKIVLNPTVYGHGYLFNDLGKDGAVTYHEGMHSISTPIAGLEGAPEGGALNEAQADLWAYTITDAEAIGEYGVAGAGIRQVLRDAGRDPDSLAWIRSVHSTLKYSQLGTRGGAFEVHRDGEIFVSTMWDLRDLLKKAEPAQQFLRPAFIDGQPTRKISAGQEAWERDFLGGLYILGLSSPDTFVAARDSVIMADRILYPTDPSDLEAPGQHEALIWQVYASHELGTHAAAPDGGRQTISTAVPQFALEQAHVGAPQGVVLEPASAKSVRVSWQPVGGAFAYEVFKRRIGSNGERQFAGVAGREYRDGDVRATGWSHVTYVTTGQTSYEDKGVIAEFFAAAGISSKNNAAGFNEMFGTEYAVRALSFNANKQVGVGDLSAGASLAFSLNDVTSALQTTVSNVTFAGGVFEFDQTLKNNGVGAFDPTAYAPINFQIVRISNSTVTAKNADDGGDGRSRPATYVYNETLPQGATSSARHFAFNDPQAQLFTFDAVLTARVRGASAAANGSQTGDGDGGGAATFRPVTKVTDDYTGTLIVGAGGNNLVSGVDYVDVPFVAKAGSFGVVGVSESSPVNGGVAPDYDLQLLDDQGRVLSYSGNLGPNEQVGAAIVPGKTYVYRVIGYASGPTQFVIHSTQSLYADEAAGGGSSSGGSSFLPPKTGTLLIQKVVRFTVNPLTKSLTFKVVQ